MDGEGPTVREAKQDAARKIEAVLEADYTPAVFRWGDSSAIVWRTPRGVNSAYLRGHLHGNGMPRGHCCHGSQSTFDEVCQSVRLNLAQNEADITSDETPAIIAGERRLESDYRSWLGFQRAYRHAKANAIGAGDCDWHRWACENGRQFIPS